MESTATTIEQPTVRFHILDELKNLKNAHGTLFVGVRPGPRIVTDHIVTDMKQYYIIKKPNESVKALEFDDVE
jgi:hypothetical protein